MTALITAGLRMAPAQRDFLRLAAEEAPNTSDATLQRLRLDATNFGFAECVTRRARDEVPLHRGWYHTGTFRLFMPGLTEFPFNLPLSCDGLFMAPHLLVSSGRYMAGYRTGGSQDRFKNLIYTFSSGGLLAAQLPRKGRILVFDASTGAAVNLSMTNNELRKLLDMRLGNIRFDGRVTRRKLIVCLNSRGIPERFFDRTTLRRLLAFSKDELSRGTSFGNGSFDHVAKTVTRVTGGKLRLGLRFEFPEERF